MILIIFNVDETGIPRDSTSRKNLDMKGSKHVIVNSKGHDKEKYTSVLKITYTGKKLF